jgi:branched-chain amino acid transport system substrate-binding protein
VKKMNRLFQSRHFILLVIASLLVQAAPVIQPKANTLNDLTCGDPLGCVMIPPGDPIHIAYALVTSGPNAALGIDSRNGVEIAIDESGGKILGHSIQFDGQDDQCSPEGGLAAGTALAADPSVVAVIGTSCSSAAVAAMPLLSAAGLVMVSPSNTRADLTEPGSPNNHPGYLRTSWSDSLQGSTAAKFAREFLGISKAAPIIDGSPYSAGIQQAFVNEFINLGGTITAEETVDPGQTDMSGVLTSIAAGTPELLFFPIFMPAAGYIINQVKATAGLTNAYLLGSDALFGPDVVTATGENVEGLMVTTPDFTRNSVKYTDTFLPAYKAKFGTDPISTFHAHAYDAFMLIKSAIKKVAVVGADGTVQIGRQALRDALYGTADFPGLTGNLTCSATGDCADPHLAVYKYHTDQYPPEYIWPFTTAVSITRDGANPTASAMVDYTVTFSGPVTGVGTGDFKLTTTGLSGAGISQVSGSRNVYKVRVNTGNGTGSLRLDLADNDSIVDSHNLPLGGVGAGNGDFTAGDAYTITRNIEVTIAGSRMDFYYLPAHGSLRQGYLSVNLGPVKIQNTETVDIVASQRVIYGGASYSEMMGLPVEQLAKEYLFPYYNNVAMDSQLRVSNAGGLNTTITVYLGPNQIDSYTLAAGGASRKNYTGRNSGPLRVTSSASNILATIRVLYNKNSYSELMGLPVNQLAKEYLFPYYNNVAMDSQLRVSNVGGASTTITVYLGTAQIDSYPLAAGGATRKSYSGRNSGPLRVTSSASNILTTIRVLYGGNSYSELMGFPASQLAQSYWYPVYDNVALDSQLRVSNVGSATTHITVYAGTQQIDSYDLGKGAATRKTYLKNTGPLQVVSSTQPILTTIRLLYGGSYYEMTGLPQSQLSTQYFFPWYNNTAMNSELRIAIP